MEKFTCWDTASVSETVFTDIGALSRSTDAVFLAAHTPARVTHHRGPEEIVGIGGGEAQVLAALLADIGTYPSNTLIAVTGNSGTGKSHIVRWVYAQLRQPRPDLHVLYVPRELSNLRDLLRSLIKGLGLPEEVGQEMLARVDDAIGDVTEPEIASRLLGAMAQALRWQFPPAASAPEETAEERELRERREILLGTCQPDGRRRGGLADMIEIGLIRDHLEREGGTLRVIAGSIAGNVADRHRSLSRFVPDDLDPVGMGKDRDIRMFLSSVKTRPGPALALLQEALDKAFPEFVGLTSGSGETLDSLFRDARIRLKESGRDLVLLFEDLVQFGPIDGALYAQFRNQPTDELAPLRVVFAVTSSNWEERAPETVKRRLRHRFEVLPIQEGPDETDAPIRDFLARYLNLVRVGRPGVEAAWSAASDEARTSGEWIPNACETREHGKPCRFADECRPGFGSADVPPIGHVGLFPFNESALRRLVRKMGTEAGTPGQLLRVALEEVLVEAGPHIKSGTYPDRRTEDHFDYRFVSTLPALKRGVPGETGDRLLRANVIWGDDRQITSSEVLDAFALPPVTDGRGPVSDEPRPNAEEPASQGAEAKPKPSAERPPLPLLVQVNAWSQRPSEFLETSVEDFREWLYRAVVDRLRLDQDLIHVERGIGKELLESVLARYSFVFPGAEYGRTPGSGRLKFDITPDESTVALLIGVMWFHHAGHWQPKAGSWAWPAGFSPGLLQRVTNGYLQSWADRVRAEVVRRTLDPSIRDEVVALDAIARACLGEGTRSPAPPGSSTVWLEPVGTWASVERVARSLLSETEKSQWLSDLATVRQSDDADPQLVDMVGAPDTEKAAVASPWLTITAICGDKRAYAAPLVLAASRLRDAIGAAAQEQVKTVQDAVHKIEEILDGADLAELAKAAREAGDRAMGKHIFRPADGWGRFTRACDLLPARSAAWSSRPPIVAEEGADLAAEAIRMQSWCRAVVAARGELEVIETSIAATTREAKYRLSGNSGSQDRGNDIEVKATRTARAIKTIVGSGEGG
jgi:hypothetical protein